MKEMARLLLLVLLWGGCIILLRMMPDQVLLILVISTILGFLCIIWEIARKNNSKLEEIQKTLKKIQEK